MARATTTGRRSRRTGDEAETDPAPAGATEPEAEVQPVQPQTEAHANPEPAAPDASVAPEPAAVPDPSPGVEPVGQPAPADRPAPEPAESPAPPVEAAPEVPAAAPAAPAPAPPERRSGGVVWLLMGGVLSAGIGAAAALWGFPPTAPAVDLGPIQARLAALEAAQPVDPGAAGDQPDPIDLAPILSRLAALEAAPTDQPVPDLGPLAARVAALESALAAVPPAPDLSALTARLEALEAQPQTDPADLAARIEALESALPGLIAAATADLRAGLQAEAAAIQSTAQDAAAAAAQAERLAVLGELGLAADSGAPAADVLARLDAPADLAAALAPFRDGLPTLAALQSAFPAVARAALAEAPVPEDAGAAARLMDFLRSQTGARSLAPREGDDTDAILSRAEAAVRAGDLPAALAELASLPPGPLAATAPWRAQAEARLAALAALADLRARTGEE